MGSSQSSTVFHLFCSSSSTIFHVYGFALLQKLKSIHQFFTFLILLLCFKSKKRNNFDKGEVPTMSVSISVSHA